MTDRPVYVITGTSRGIGREVARTYAETSAATVVGCARGPSTLTHSNYDHYQVDLSDESQVRAWVRAVKTKHGRIDGLVCNVGLVQSALFLAVTPTPLFHQFLQTNVTTTFLVCREISKVMLTQRYGRIVTISSIMASLHEPGTAVYSATKAAVTELTKVMARELAPAGITCNVIAPSLLNTETSAAMGEEWKVRILEKQTIARALEATDLCHALSFFLSPQSSFITGQVLDLCLVH